jgi:hypothetical protein
MTTQITCVYTATASGTITAAALVTAMAAVPLDVELLRNYGLRVTSDTTAAGGLVVTRTIVLAMNPSAAATATSTLFPGDGSASPIDLLTLSAAGLDYVAVPVVMLPQVPAGNIRRAQAHATLNVQSLTVTAPGSGYPGGATIVFSGGGLAPGGVQATATPTIGGGGAVTGVTLTSGGGPYTFPPTATVVGVGGSGAILLAHLGLSGVVLDDPGGGYIPPAPAVTITPLFKALFPDGTDQVSPTAGWMTEILQSALRTPVVAAVPVVA